MPKIKTPERDRLKKAHYKKKTRLKLDAPEGFRAPTKFEMVRPKSPEEAKEFLRAVADHLSNVPYASGRFRFVAMAIKRFLRNSKRGLSQELALVAPPGRPSTFQERMRKKERGRKIVQSKHAGNQWYKIADEVGLKDKRSVKKIYKEFAPQLEKEERLAHISKDVEAFLREPPKSS